MVRSRKETANVEFSSVVGRLTVGELVRDIRQHELFIETPQSYISHGRLRECHCICGLIKLISEAALNSGRVQSCGCLRTEINNKAHITKMNKLKITNDLKHTTQSIKIEQFRLRKLQQTHVYIRDEKAIELCASGIRRLFEIKQKLKAQQVKLQKDKNSGQA